MSMMKKYLCLGLAIVFTLAIALSGCGTEKSDSTTGTTAEVTTTPTETAAVPAEPLKFTILADMINWTRDNLDINDSEEDKLWSEFSNTDISYITPPHDNYLDFVSTRIASGDYPEVIQYSPDTSWTPDWKHYAKEGIFISLEEYWNSGIGKNAAETMYSDENPFLRCTYNGERCGIPVPGNKSASEGTMVRKDWLDALGLQKPETLDEYRVVLKAFTYNDPDKNSKNDTYGFTARKDLSYAATFLGAFGLESHQRVTYDLIDGKIVAEQSQEDYKKYLQYMRTLVFEDKVFVPDVILRTSDQWKQDMFAGVAGMWQHSSVRIDEFFMKNMMAANPDWKERGIEIDYLKPPTGGPNTGKTGIHNNLSDGGYAIHITDKAKDPQLIFNYFIWVYSSPEVKDLVKYGIAGRDHTVVNGKKQWTDNLDSLNLQRCIETALVAAGAWIDDEYYARNYGERGVEALKFNLEYNPPAKTFLLQKPLLPEDTDYPDTDTVVLEYSLRVICGDIGVEEGFSEMNRMLSEKGLDKKIAAYQEWYDSN